jgi:hypothetical protein
MNDKSQNARYYDEQRRNKRSGATKNENYHRPNKTELIPLRNSIQFTEQEKEEVNLELLKQTDWKTAFLRRNYTERINEQA